MRAHHSQNCGKGFARLVMMPISKLNLCKAELKKQKLIESEPFPKLRKGFARLEMMFISKLKSCKAELKDSPALC